MNLTSQQWVESVEADPEKLKQWLQRQYVGEVLAAERIRALAERDDVEEKHKAVLLKISVEEWMHSVWIGGLLDKDDLPDVNMEKDRYWREIDLESLSLDELYAAGAHAEKMRLERIVAIIDSDLPKEIRDVFAMILPMEQFHAKAFESFASDDAMSATMDKHLKGMEALNLIM